MNEKRNANWRINLGNLSFFPFSAFPRTGPSLFLANILRHLWELSHEDSLSAGGSPVSGTAALPAALASRAPTERVFLPAARKWWNSITVTPMSCFFHRPPPPHAQQASHGITRAHKHLWKDESHCPTTSQKSKSVSDWRRCWRHGSPHHSVRDQEDFKEHYQAVTAIEMFTEACPVEGRCVATALWSVVANRWRACVSGVSFFFGPHTIARHLVSWPMFVPVCSNVIHTINWTIENNKIGSIFFLFLQMASKE